MQIVHSPRGPNRETRRAFAACVGCGSDQNAADSVVVAHMARMFGNAEFERAAKTTGRSNVLQSAFEVAAATTHGLASVPPENRHVVLGAISNPEFVREVAQVAGKIPGNPNTKADFALVMLYVTGAGEDATGQQTHRADAYRTARAALDQALSRKTPPPTKLSGLGAVSVNQIGDKGGSCYSGWYSDNNRRDRIAQIQRTFKSARGTVPSDAEILQWAATGWCSDDTLIGAMKKSAAPTANDLKERHGVAAAFQSAVDFFGSIGDKLVQYIADAAEKASAVFCKGFKALLGESVGGVLCAIFDVLFKLISGTFKTVITIIVQALQAVVEFIGKLLVLDLKGAVISFFKRVNTIVLLAVGGPFADLIGIPMTKAEAVRKGKDPAESFEGLGERLTDKQPLFVVNLSMSIVAVVLGPNMTTIGALVIVMSDAVGVLYAPSIMKTHAKFLAGVAKEKIEAGIALLVKLISFVVQAVITINDLMDKFKKAWANFQQNLQSRGGAWQAAKDVTSGVWDNIKNFATRFWDKLKSLKSPADMKALGDSVSELFDNLPLLIIALVDDGSNTLAPLTNAAKDLYTTAVKTWDEAKRQWELISKDLKPADRDRALADDRARWDAAAVRAQKTQQQQNQSLEQAQKAKIDQLQKQIQQLQAQLGQQQSGLVTGNQYRSTMGTGSQGSGTSGSGTPTTSSGSGILIPALAAAGIALVLLAGRKG